MAIRFNPKNDGIKVSQYRDQRFKGSVQEQERKLLNSSTLYIGNLSYFTTEEQVYELFSRTGHIRRVIMGVDRFKLTPCGFCFVDCFAFYSFLLHYLEADIDEFAVSFVIERAIILFFGYYLRKDAEDAVRCINGTRLDDRIIRTDWDAGFVDGRQFGRGKHGGQVRDEYRKDFDPGRGGWNKVISSRNMTSAEL